MGNTGRSAGLGGDPATCEGCFGDALSYLALLVLPVHRHVSCAAGRHCVLVIRTIFPSHRAVRGNLDELELHGRTTRQRRVEEPVGIVGIEHGSDGGIERRAPASEFDGAAGNENVVAGVGRRRVVHRESDRNERRGQHGKWNRVGGRAGTVLQLRLINAVADIGHSERDGTISPRLNRGCSRSKQHLAGGRAQSSAGDCDFDPRLADGGTNGSDFWSAGRAGGLPNGDGVGRQSEVVGRIVASAAGADGEAGTPKQSAEIVGVRAGGQRGVKARDRVTARVIFVDGHQDDVVEELALVNVDIVVDPALLITAVSQRVVGTLAKSCEFVDELVSGGRSVEGAHPDPAVGVASAAGVVVQILLVAVEDDGNAARGQQIGHRFVQAVVVVVQGKEARLVVAVEKSDLIIVPGEVGILAGNGPVEFGEVVITGKDVAHGLIHTEVKFIDAALVRELIGVVIHGVPGIVVVPLAVEEARSLGEHGVSEGIFPTPGDVFDGVEPEGVDAVRLKLVDRSFEIAVDGRVFLVEVLQAEQGVVLELIAVVIVGDVWVVMEVAVGIVAVGGHEGAVVIERAELAASVVVGVIVGPIHNDLNAVRVGGGHQIVKGRPGIAAVAEVFFDLHEVARVISVVGRGYGCIAVQVQIFVIDTRRDPDGGDAHAFEVGHLLLNAGQVASPIGVPIAMGGVEKAGAFGRIVVGGVAIDKSIGHDLVNDLLFEVLCAEEICESEQRREEQESRGSHGTTS